MRSSRGQVPLLRTLWALGTSCLIAGSLLAMVAAPLPTRVLWELLAASGASFLIHAWLTKQEKH